MRWVTTQSPSAHHRARAPRWPYLPMASVTSAMTIAMRTTRAPRSFFLRWASTSWWVTSTRPRAMAAKMGCSTASTATLTTSMKMSRCVSLRSSSQNTSSEKTTTGIRYSVK